MLSDEIKVNDTVTFEVSQIFENPDGVKMFKLGEYYLTEDALNKMRISSITTTTSTFNSSFDEENMDNNFVKMVGYDTEGNAHVLFDVTKVNNDIEKMPMPELETGMFIILDLTNTEIKEKYYGFVYDNKIIWQSGGWDYVASIHTDKRCENNVKGKLTIYEKDKINWFPEDNYKNYIFWTGEVWYG